MAELLYREDPYLRSCAARVVASRDGALELDRTVFYPLGGGQPGDTGTLRLADGAVLRVLDARKGEREGEVLHVLEPGTAPPAEGVALEAEVDWPRRHRHMRFHTALHLLGAVVKAPVTGGRIAEDKAHLDFDTDMDRLIAAKIESGLNALVAAGHDTRTSWISDAELDSRPDLVKTMSVAPPRGAGRVRLLEIPGVDLQACGGTHVANTREVGRLVVARIRSEGKRNKRVTIAFAEG
jgi:misacylated tRNA(Ala) deacylase